MEAAGSLDTMTGAGKGMEGCVESGKEGSGSVVSVESAVLAQGMGLAQGQVLPQGQLPTQSRLPAQASLTTSRVTISPTDSIHKAIKLTASSNNMPASMLSYSNTSPKVRSTSSFKHGSFKANSSRKDAHRPHF